MRAGLERREVDLAVLHIAGILAIHARLAPGKLHAAKKTGSKSEMAGAPRAHAAVPRHEAACRATEERKEEEEASKDDEKLEIKGCAEDGWKKGKPALTCGFDLPGLRPLNKGKLVASM